MTIETPPDRRRRGRDTVTALAVIAAFLLVLAVLRFGLFDVLSVPSAAMNPTLVEGDIVLVWRPAYTSGGTPRRGDLVAFTVSQPQRTTYIKRVVGRPGDRVQLRDGQLYVNGKPVPRTHVEDVTESFFGAVHTVSRFRETLDGQSYLTNDFGPDGDFDTTSEVVVPPGAYFTLGDNRDNSMDSRMGPEIGGIGFVPAASLVGRVDWLLSSPKRNKAFVRP